PQADLSRQKLLQTITASFASSAQHSKEHRNQVKKGQQAAKKSRIKLLPKRAYQYCRGRCPFLFPSAQSIDQKSGHTTHRKIKAGQHHTKHTQSQQGIFAGAAVPVISDQRQQEEWQIADKHNLHGGMEYDRPRHDHDERSKKAFFLPKIFPEKPQITKQAVCDPCRKHHTLHINCHIHERKQIRKKIQWIIESIVSKIVDILPSADLHGKIREK